MSTFVYFIFSSCIHQITLSKRKHFKHDVDSFEDIGHSNQAVELLEQYFKGDLDGYVASEKKEDARKENGNQGGSNMGIFLVAGVVIAAAVAATQFM
jgi:hypothetical protein